MTTRSTEFADRGRAGGGPVSNRARPPSAASVARVSASTSASSALDFRGDRSGAHPGCGGVWLRRALIFVCASSRHGLIRRKRVDREESRRVAGEPVHGHHPNPAIDAVERPRRLAVEQIVAQRADLAQRIGVIEDEQIVARPPDRTREYLSVGPRSPSSRAAQAWVQQDPAEWVDVAGHRNAAKEGRFERVVPRPENGSWTRVSGRGETIDEEARELRLEARAIRDLVKAVGGALPARPELVDERLSTTIGRVFARPTLVTDMLVLAAVNRITIYKRKREATAAISG